MARQRGGVPVVLVEADHLEAGEELVADLLFEGVAVFEGFAGSDALGELIMRERCRIAVWQLIAHREDVVVEVVGIEDEDDRVVEVGEKVSAGTKNAVGLVPGRLYVGHVAVRGRVEHEVE